MTFDIVQLFPRPDAVPRRDYLTYLILSLVCISTCLIGSILIAVIYFVGNTKLLGAVFLCFVITLSIWPFNRAGKLVAATNLCLLWVYIFSVVNTIYFGWNAGFQYHIIAQMVIYSTHSKVENSQLIFVCSLCLGTYLVLHRMLFDVVSLNSSFIQTLHLVNTLSACLIMVFSNIYISRILKKLIERLNHSANTDSLTKLVNRRHMNIELERQTSITKRHNSSSSVILIDIDHFKKINDTYGHDAGDFVLKEFAKLLTLHLRKADVVARWGGEEFLVLAPFTNKEQAGLLAEKLRNFTEEHVFMYKEINLKITISLGVTELDVQKTIQESLSDTDKFLYQAKAAGRNVVIMQ